MTFPTLVCVNWSNSVTIEESDDDDDDDDDDKQDNDSEI